MALALQFDGRLVIMHDRWEVRASPATHTNTNTNVCKALEAPLQTLNAGPLGQGPVAGGRQAALLRGAAGLGCHGLQVPSSPRLLFGG